MCGSMADIQSATAEIRPGDKEDTKKKKPQDENIMVGPIPQGDHCKYDLVVYDNLYIINKYFSKK